VKRSPPRDALAEYRRKRAADRTPEPFGARGARPRLFVVQQHAARRIHHDFRLEWNGVLLSWAVPRGPSLDPSAKRLAVRVEDHPLDYADFEGVIPEGNYGAGAVILWDRGRWTPVEDVEAGLAKGKLLFDLEGYKLRGRYTLVRTGGKAKAEGRDWLLIKKPDAWARPGAEGAGNLPEESILSGLTLREMREGSERAARCREALARLGAPRREVHAKQVRPMLAEARDAPFSAPGWLFEPKYDGYRIVAGVRGKEARLFTRRGEDATATFPEVTAALAALPYRDFVLDGELVALDGDGRPSFARLQRRARLRRRADAERGSVELPVTYFAFDLVAFEGFDLRPLPLAERKRLLEPLLPRRGPVRFAPAFAGRGEDVYAEATRLGLEGVVAKRADSRYEGRRSGAWLKVRRLRSDDFVVVGFTAPARSRAGFGALHLGAYAGGRLVWCGRVGSGFTERDLRELRARLDALARPTPACDIPTREARGGRFVEPRLVCEVRYTEWTEDGLLRQPVFVRLREDKRPEECAHPTGGTDAGGDPEPPAREPPVAAREIAFTNLDKVFWPGDGITKGDLIAYHRDVAPWLLPYLRDRPLVLTRYPDGIAGKSFFQKDAPAWAPEWVRTERMWSEHGGREISYFVCDDLEALLWVVNLGTIPLHVWSSRVATLAQPDWCILDLDPKGAPFAHVVEVARALHALCDEAGLPCFVKTSGSTGLHVLVPLGRRLTYEQSRSLAAVLAGLVVQRLPERATVARALSARRGRVYVDTGQNGHGRLLAAPFCVRPLPGAPVSMPLRWSEVTPRLDVARFTLRTALARLRRLGEDPLRPVLDTSPAWLPALERLGALAAGSARPARRRSGRSRT
jgi:bifunctional non-homologous end joining protein LigD